MGFLDFLKSTTKCPWCGNPNAKKSGSRILCPNPNCTNFDSSVQSGAPAASAAPAKPAKTKPGGFVPTNPLSIRYRNFQGQEKTFTADPDSCVRKKNHITVRVAPSGQTITLSRDRIQNLAEIEAHCAQKVAPDQAWPSPRERQVLNYHKRHGSTSPLYEKVRAKFPDW